MAVDTAHRARPSRTGPAARTGAERSGTSLTAARRTRAAAAPGRESTRFSDADKAQARANITLAFSLLGLVADGHPVCPECGASKNKVKLFPDKGGWHCYRRGHHGSDNSAVDLLMDKGGYSFVDAVNVLLGRPARRAGKVVDLSELEILEVEPAFRAVVDTEVYDALVRAAHVSLAAAQEYYRAWHIAEKAVAEAGGRMVTDQRKLEAELTERFGLERLAACGLVKLPEGERRRVAWMLNRNYPVIEPHITPRGRVVGMQFRPSGAQKQKVVAHKAWKARFGGQLDAHGNERDASEVWAEASAQDRAAAGPKAEYVPPFMSLRGAGPDSLVGCGLFRIARLAEPSLIYVVEGYKDLLAARSMGAEAYAIPGVGVVPPPKVLELFRRGGHTLLLCLDGDEAGAEGRARMAAVLDEAEIPYREKVLPDGMDVADVLVSRNAATGCRCATCIEWRASHL